MALSDLKGLLEARQEHPHVVMVTIIRGGVMLHGVEGNEYKLCHTLLQWLFKRINTITLHCFKSCYNMPSKLWTWIIIEQDGLTTEMKSVFWLECTTSTGKFSGFFLNTAHTHIEAMLGLHQNYLHSLRSQVTYTNSKIMNSIII